MGPLISGKSRLVKYYSIWPDVMCLFFFLNPCIDSIDSLQIIPRNGEDKFPNDFLKLSYDLLHPQQLYIYVYSIQYIYIYIPRQWFTCILLDLFRDSLKSCLITFCHGIHHQFICFLLIPAIF